MATYWGGSVTNFSWSASFDSSDRCSSRLEMSAHTATHIDAPLHFIPGGLTIDNIPLTRLAGTGRILDLREAPRNECVIDPTFFQEATSGIQPDEIVVLHTGIWRDFGKERFTADMPVLSLESTELLLSKKIAALATDCISVDPLRSLDQVNHRLILGAGIPIIEGVSNLDQLNENPVFLLALPLKLVGREAAPARVVAIEGITNTDVQIS